MDKGKKINLQMGLLMSVTLSLCLSATGLLSAGQFTVPALLINFAVSFVISMIISILVPMNKVNAAADRKLGLRPGELKTRFFESFLSDIIYTPILTIAMVTIAYFNVKAHAPADKVPPYAGMLIKSLVISLLVGYVLIFIFMPIFLRFVLKKNGMGPMGPGAGMGPNAGHGPNER